MEINFDVHDFPISYETPLLLINIITVRFQIKYTMDPCGKFDAHDFTICVLIITMTEEKG